MGKKDKSKKGKGAEKTAAKTAKKAASKLKKELAAKGEEDIETLIASFVEKDLKKERIAEDLVDAPTARSGCSFLANPDKDLLYLFGGSYFNGNKTFMYNDLFTYNIKKNTWLRLCTPLAPPPRCAQQAVIVAQGGGQIWMFGGEFASPTQSQFYHYKDLWCYHVNEKRWEKVDAAGGPSSRSGHRMVTNGKNIYLFGGFYESIRDAKYFNDIYQFSISTRQWTKIEPVNQGPCPRSGVQMVILDNNKICIYGGYSKEKLGKDAEKGVTHTDMWYLHEDTTSGKWKWSSVRQGGCKPGARSGMAIVPGSQPNQAYLFGGVCDREEDEETIVSVCLADLFLLEADKGVWRELDLKQEKQKDSGEPVDTAMEELQIEGQEEPQEEIKTDGVFTVKISTASASATAAAEDPKENTKATRDNRFWPHPRMSACLALKHGILYVYGGIFESGDKQLALRDLYAIDVHKMDEWKTLVALNKKELEWFDSESEDEEEEDEEEEDDDEESDEGADEEMQCE